MRPPSFLPIETSNETVYARKERCLTCIIDAFYLFSPKDEKSAVFSFIIESTY
jgi:hypothetical protein